MENSTNSSNHSRSRPQNLSSSASLNLQRMNRPSSNLFTPNNITNPQSRGALSCQPVNTDWTSSSSERTKRKASSSVPQRVLGSATKRCCSFTETDSRRGSSTSRTLTATESEEEDGGLTEQAIEQHRNNRERTELAGDEGQSRINSVLSAVWSGGKLGAAYYDTETSQLHMLMDVIETSDFQFLKRVKDQVQPDAIITSSKQDERFLSVLKGEENESNEEPVMSSKEVEVLPSIDFSFEVCKRRIVCMNNLPGMPHHLTDSERTLYMNSIVPFDSVNMVRATGALLKYIEKKRVGMELEDPDIQVPVLALKTFSLSGLLIVDNNTYSALQIFQKESHPSVYKAGCSAKEGLSLYGVTNRTKSSLGSKLLRMWFFRPTRDVSVIKERQKAISFFMNPRNSEVTVSLQDCLKNVKNITRILTRMTSAQATIGDWKALYKTVYNAVYISELCRTVPNDVTITKAITDSFTEELNRIASLIHKIVDFEESAEQNRFVVKPGVDPVLDNKKRTYNGLPDLMTKVAREELNNLSSSITECNVIYLPQLGYLLAIPRNAEMDEEKDFQIEGLEFVFLNNNMVHYKSANTKELDHQLGDTQCDINDHETAIMHRLQNYILEHTKVLLDVMEYAAEIDCIIALAECARENNYCCPTISTENVIEIKRGRHPLQELCVTQFVPNDTTIDDDKGRMKILTGPNASGKSVYLKQVGLIVFLAHIGSFVPAESATIGITDRIFSRIHTQETVSVGLSTFMIDLNQIAMAVQSATKHSLVIIDEFGKGTATVDGLSLLCATLRHWLSRGNSCPKILVSTHFHSLIQQQLLPDVPTAKYQTMETMQDGKELVFLYQLIDGYTNSSYACHIASLAGLPPQLVKRGAEVSELIRTNKPVLRTDDSSTEAQRKRFDLVAEKFLQMDIEKENTHAFLTDYVIPVCEGRI